MRPEAAARIAALPDDALVLDVGGWAAPLHRADWVIDLLPHATRGLYGAADPARERFSAETWVQADVCGPEPWPFPDGRFEVAVCSHTLEDVRDPVFVCAELQRVARSGYVEVPAAVEELTFGVQGPWVGWSHHRWITEREGDGLVFAHKPHLLSAPGRHLPAGALDDVRPEDRTIGLWWDGALPARERVLVGAEELDPWLAGVLDRAAVQAGRPAEGTGERSGRVAVGRVGAVGRLGVAGRSRGALLAGRLRRLRRRARRPRRR